MPGALKLHDKFPNLQGQTQDVDDFDLYQYFGDSWGIMFMHPGDFTPVCTTELGEAAVREQAFKERNVKIVGFSCNSQEQHKVWIKDIEAVTGNQVKFPLFCDPDRTLALEYGWLDEEHFNQEGLALASRTVYILTPAKKIALIMTYPASMGRSFDEIFRAVDSLMRTHLQHVATPVDWFPGQDVIVDFPLDNAEADKVFGKEGYRVVEVPSEQGKDLNRNYLRMTADPAKPKLYVD